MADLASLHSWPVLDRPALVVCLEGWIDAGQAAATAMATLRESLPTQMVATFDADELIDHRARRPILRLDAGVEKDLRWPELRLEAASGAARGGGRDILLLSGPEPDMRWHRFVTEVIALSSRLGVELVVGLGAFPAPVPHTRPVRLAGTSVERALAQQIGVVPATIDVPAGAQGALEHGFGRAGVASVGLWARVPHYASALPYPAASAALLERLGALASLEVDTRDLHAAAAVTAAHIDQLIAGSDEHAAMVRQLELSHDEEEGLGETPIGDLPSGDEIAAELERFLRGER